MTDEKTKYIELRSKHVGEDPRGNPLYDHEIWETNISREEFKIAPYRDVRSFGFWSLGNLNKRLPRKNITLRFEIDD